MSSSPFHFLTLLTLVFAAPAAAQPPADGPPRRPPGEDTRLFRAVLKLAGLKPISSLEDVLDRPADKILIVLGKTDLAEYLAEDGQLSRFLRAGGGLLIATDRYTSEKLKNDLGVQISGQFVPVPREDGYRDYPDCALMVPPRQSTPATRHPILKGIGDARPVVTNKPSYLRDSQRPIVAELHVPGAGYSVARILTVRDRLMFAAAWTIPDKGRAVVLADHSLFIDQMMGQTDTDNITFAINIGRWLSEDGRRKEVMLYDDGVVQDSFDVNLNFVSPGFLPPIEVLVPLINQTIGQMEDRDEFNQVLSEVAGGPDRILRGLLLLFTLGLLLQGGYRFLNSKFRTDLRPVKAAPAAAPVPDLERRHQAILARGNLVESAHELAHQTFVALGAQSEKVDQSQDWWQPAAMGKISLLKLGPYRVFVTGSWWQREIWLRRVARLWRTATGRVRHVSARRLQGIAESLRDLHDAVADGKIHLVTIHRSRRPGGALTTVGHR